MDQIIIPSQTLPVIGKTDICVIGGSCSGVFAAVRAARLGAKVTIMEKQNRFGGVAVSSLVSIWHSLLDTDYRRTVIAGLTQEAIDRLQRRSAVKIVPENPSAGSILNTEELSIELDRMVVEAGITPMLHTVFSQPYFRDGHLAGVIVENKSGRGVILADYFIDASGDGDLCHRAGFSTWRNDGLQPPTTCARFSGWKLPENFDLGVAIRAHAGEYGLPDGFIWGAEVPGSDIFMLAGTRVLNCDCANAPDLTAAEIEGRRQVRAIMDILREHHGIASPVLQTLPSMIGIRETRHIASAHRLTGKELLAGTGFDDAIAYGTYRVDIHQHDRGGVLFRYLDGTEVFASPGHPHETGRWRDPVADEPKYYQIPLRSLIPTGSANVIAAGRMIDADAEAFGAVRVMVNLNQTGEAAGVTAMLALNSGGSVAAVPAAKVRAVLNSGGSCL